jgi:lipid A 3-O-deacylase
MHTQRFTVRLVFSAFMLLTGLPTLVLADEVPTCAGKPGVKGLKPYPDVYNFYYENDLINGTDNNYTNGLKVSWVSANLESYVEDPCLPLWIRKLNGWSNWLQPGDFTSRNMVVTGGQAIYTPRDLTRTDLIKDDRPYAGWLYLGLAWNARDELTMDTVELDVGVVGPASLARQTQNLVHDLRGFDHFAGWDNQLHNEFGMQLVRERKTRAFIHDEKNGPKVDLITHYGASIGNVKTYLNTGAEVRIGTWLPNDFGTSTIRPASDSNAPLMGAVTRRLSNQGGHAFAAIDARIVAHDIFLDGNTFVDSHSVDKRYFVSDLALGVAWQWQGGKVTYSHIVRSKQFREQPNAHRFGSVTLSLEY